MLGSRSESESDFGNADDEDVESRSATIASILSRSIFYLGSVPYSAISIDLAEAMVTDVDDSLTLSSPMVVSPRCEQVASSQQLLTLLSTPVYKNTKSSSSAIIDDVARILQSSER
jgi:hypothetical protein